MQLAKATPGECICPPRVTLFINPHGHDDDDADGELTPYDLFGNADVSLPPEAWLHAAPTTRTAGSGALRAGSVGLPGCQAPRRATCCSRNGL